MLASGLLLAAGLLLPSQALAAPSPAPEAPGSAAARSPRLQRLRSEISEILEETRPMLDELRGMEESYLKKPGLFGAPARREGLRASLQGRIERLVALEDEWNAAIEEHRAQAALAAVQGLMGGGDPARAGADYAFLQGENDFAARSLVFRHSVLDALAQEQASFGWMRSMQRKRLLWLSAAALLAAAAATGSYLLARRKD